MVKHLGDMGGGSSIDFFNGLVQSIWDGIFSGCGEDEYNDEMEQELEEEDEYDGEDDDIIDDAISNEEEYNLPTSIAMANVNKMWMARFFVVENMCIDGIWWKSSPNFKNSSIYDKIAYLKVLYIDAFWSLLAAYMFCPLYYLFKGMWLKAIIYALFSFLIICLFDSSISTCFIIGAIFALIAPFDYYRLKMLGKQW